MYPYQPVRTLKVKSTHWDEDAGIATRRMTVVVAAKAKGKHVKAFVENLPTPPFCSTWKLVAKRDVRNTRNRDVVVELVITTEVV